MQSICVEDRSAPSLLYLGGTGRQHVCCSGSDYLWCMTILCVTVLQAAARSLLGELVTAFDKISDHTREIKRGDIVQISTKPALLGEVLFFTVEKVKLALFLCRPA